MSYRLELLLLGLPTPERNSRRHWRVRNEEDQAWRRNVAFAVLGRRPGVPLTLARVTYTRHSAVEPDPDNLAESFKPITDALRRAGILEEDRSRNFVGGRPDVRWQKAPPRRGHITILVEEPNDGERERSGADAPGSGD